MTSRDFCYWLQGYFEVSGTTNVGEKETQIIRNHLNMVFKHEIDPSHGDTAHQKVLSDIHKGSFIAGSGGTGAGLDMYPKTTIMNC